MNIKNGKLKATEIEQGDSITGVLVGFKENQYGKHNILMTVDNQTVEIMVAGNLRFVKDDLDKGKLKLYQPTTITRVEDKDINGYSTSQFKTTQEGQTLKTHAVISQSPAVPTGELGNAAVKAKLAAIQAKRTAGTASGSNT